MTSCSNPSQVCWEQYHSRELIMCLKARDSPSAPTIDWKKGQETEITLQQYVLELVWITSTAPFWVFLQSTDYVLCCERPESPFSATYRSQLEYNIKSHRSKNKFKVSRDIGKTGFCLFDIQYSIRLTTSFGIHYMIQENLIIFLGNKQKKPNHLHFCNRAKCISH